MIKYYGHMYKLKKKVLLIYMLNFKTGYLICLRTEFKD